MEKYTKILIDTNILVYMFTDKIDIFSNIESVILYPKFYVLDKTYKEIEQIYKDKPLKKKLLLRYLKKLENIKKFEIIKVSDNLYDKFYKKVDKLLIYFSNQYIIYTNDKKLTEKIKKRNKKVLTLKRNSVVFY